MRRRGEGRLSWDRWPLRAGLWVTGALGVVVLIGLLYSAAVHSLPMNSDGATVVLEGKAMSGGNLLLNHWGLSLDSFWLVDVPLYAIAVLIAGVHPSSLGSGSPGALCPSGPRCSRREPLS